MVCKKLNNEIMLENTLRYGIKFLTLRPEWAWYALFTNKNHIKTI